MQISVVIPSFNRKHTLARALLSIVDQTSAVDEIIVVDDGSTDGSSRFIEQQFPQVKLIQQQNQGVSAARNRGIEAARHDWIALLDSDDSWFAHKIFAIRDAHRIHPEFILYHSDEIWIRNGKRVNPMNKHQKSGGWVFEQCLPLCVISPSAVVIQKSVLQSLGMFDEKLPACEDYDLWLRLCHLHPVHYIDQALVTKFGGHEDQLSRQFAVMDQFRIRSLNRLLQRETLTSEAYYSARKMLLSKLEILLNGAVKHKNQKLIDEFFPIRQTWTEETVSC
jgi:glycosyltransferase involved in cell wall biosynthesis